MDVLQKIFAALQLGGCLIIRDAMGQKYSAHRVVVRSEKWAVWFG